MKKLLLFLVAFGLAAAGAAYWISPGRNGSEEGYSFESVKYGTMTDVVSATGIVKPKQIALVFAKTPGTVEDIIGKVGQHVEKDQPLFKVNSEMAKNSLERAKAALQKAKDYQAAAKTGWDRMNEVVDKGYGSQKELIELQMKHASATEAVKEAEAALQQANLAMDWTTVKAPIAGIIIDKNLYLGQPVGLSATVSGGGSGSTSGLGQSGLGGAQSAGLSASMLGMTETRVPFIIASDLGDLEVYAQISQADVSRVKAGQKAEFTVDSFPDEKFEGEVTEINLMPVMIQGATVYPAVIKVKNQKQDGDWILRPGMTVNVDITRDIHKDVWKLPSAATTLQLDPHYITPAAQQKLVSGKPAQGSSQDWVPVWTMGNDKKPWPIFARVGGKGEHGKPGIKENNYTEVLEWDPELAGKIKKDDEKTYPQLIIAVPQPKMTIFEGKTPFKIS